MYDYVIVGAGSAGCVLAARLTENPSARVLLLEAGPPDDADEIHIPAAVNLLFQSPYDWGFRTVPQDRAAGQSVYWPRGKVIGGSSSINAMIYIRGNKYDYNTWRDEYGCDGWGYNDVLPYFIRAEHNSRGAIAYHGGAGPLSVIDPKFRSPASTAFVQSAVNAGSTANKDFNGANQDGVGFYQVTQKDGRRCSAADAYLHPAKDRPNLTVKTDALATSVLIEGGHAVGVRYLQRGTEHVARANSEVILCGGAINSPQLLMLSGIGPADHLRDHDIRVIVDSPGVGANLSDHPIVTALWSTPSMKSLAELAGPKNLFRWQLTHSGPMTTNIAQAGGFVRSETGLPAPDIQWHVLPVPLPQRRPGRPDRPRHVCPGHARGRAQPGPDYAAQQRPAAQAADRPRLPVRPGRHRCAGPRHRPGQGDRRRQADAQDLQDRAGARARRAHRRGVA